MKNLPLIRLLLAACCLPGTASALPPAPRSAAWEIMDLPAENGALCRCIVVGTVPGVLYRIRSSPDMENWETSGEIYGLGHQFAIAMKETTPPPPPDPDAPPPPPPPEFQVSLTMRAASGGGIVLSWRSLDTGAAMRRIVAGTLDSAWASTPLYAKRFGAHQFFILHPAGEDTSPAQEGEPAGANDAAMLAAFQEHLAEINAEVTASLARSRNTPPPPQNPGSKHFWRIEADWSLDSDRDGSLDFAEFAVLAAGGANAALADAMNADSDGDGTADGEQIDADEDGIADAFDGASIDPVIDWVKVPEPRFAAFPGGGPPPSGPGEREEPLLVNDRGAILYATHFWRAGELEELITYNEQEGLSGCQALGMNNSGTVIGIGMAIVLRDPDSEGGGGTTTVAPEPVVVVWPELGPDIPPLLARFALPGTPPADILTAIPLPEWQWTNPQAEIPRDSLIDDTGRFFATTVHKKADTPDARARWCFGGTAFDQPAESNPEASPDPAPPFASFVLAPGVFWGPESGGVSVCTVNGEDHLETSILRFARRPGAKITAIAGKTGPPRRHSPGAAGDWAERWPASTTLSRKCLDVSASGFFLRNSGSIWLVPDNPATFADSPSLGGDRSFRKFAPGIPDSLPWNATPRLSDTTPEGWMLASRLIPAEQPVSTLSLMPLVVADDQFATGVDDTTLRAYDSADSPEDNKFWIMVPAGGGDPNATRFLSPAGPDLEIEFAPPENTIASAAKLAAPDTPVDWSAEPDAEGDLPLPLRWGTSVSLSAPVALKAMKRRTLKIHVWHVTLPQGGGIARPMEIFTEEQIEPFLDDIFLPQVNLSFEASVDGELAPDQLDWDIGLSDFLGEDEPTRHNGRLDVLTMPDDEDEAGREAMRIRTEHHDDGASINIYLVGGAAGYGFPLFRKTGPDTFVPMLDKQSEQVIAGGITDVNNRLVWIHCPDRSDGPGGEAAREAARSGMLRTLAHEIGHVMIGPGHPDQNRGPAPLYGTDYRKRLMHSLSAERQESRLLVKREWDKIDEFLKTEEQKGRL